MNLSRAFNNLNYLAAVVLFLVGLYAVAIKPNLVKKVMGINIMETAVFLFIVSIGYVEGGVAPITDGTVKEAMVNPIPQALILTGIVVAVSTTAVALAICIRLHERYGTLDSFRIQMKDSL